MQKIKIPGLIFCLLVIFCAPWPSSNAFAQKSESPEQLSAETTPTLSCEISIVGGGAAGLFMAYQLGPVYKNKVCLFEKENRLGGRIYDIDKNGQTDDGPFIAMGARRVMNTQDVVFKLAVDLGLELETPVLEAQLIFARGLYSTNPDDFVSLYPGVEFDRKRGDAPTQLLQLLLNSAHRQDIDQYPDFKSYVVSVLGLSGFEYLRDMSRFRGNYEYALSARAYLEFLQEDIGVCCVASYPVGGMSAFIRALARKAQDHGVRIYKEEPVTSINKAAQHYVLKTTRHVVRSERVVITVPPKAFDHIKGDIARAVQSQPQYKSLIGVSVVTIAQWYDKPWWQGIRRVEDDKKVWRAWTTQSCINSIEIPEEQYAAEQNVIRAAYSDRKDCIEKWRELAKRGKEAIEQEVKQGLEHLFMHNGVTRPVEIGHATKTIYWEWPDGWHFIRAGYPFSTKDIFNWAVQPLANENIALAGESYNPQRSGWSDGAYKSAIHLLNTKYGFNL